MSYKNIEKYRWVILVILSILFGVIQIQMTNDWQSLNIDNLIYYFAPTDQSSSLLGYYLFLMPLFSLILSGGLWPREKNNHRLSLDFIRKNKKDFINQTLKTNIVLGGVSVTMPLLFNLLFALLKCHHFDSRVALLDGWGFNVTGKFWAGSFFDTHAFFAILFTLVIYFIWGILWATFGLFCSELSKMKYSEYLYPFLMLFILEIVTTILNVNELSPTNFLYFAVAQGSSLSGVGLFGTTIAMIFINMMLYQKVVNKDVI